MSTIKPPTNQPSVRPDASTSPKSGIPIDQPAKSVTEPSAVDQPDHGKGANSLGTTPKTDAVDPKMAPFSKDYPKAGITEAEAKAGSWAFGDKTAEQNQQRADQRARESATYAQHQGASLPTAAENAGVSPQYADAHQDQFPSTLSKLDNTVPNSLNTDRQQYQTSGLEGVDLENAQRNAAGYDALRDPISGPALVDWLRVSDADAYEFSLLGHTYRVTGSQIAMMGLNPQQVANVIRHLQINIPASFTPIRKSV